jgi:hypothetical protein
MQVMGFGFVSLIIALLGLVSVGIGLALGVGYSHPLGGMVGLILGIGAIAVALIFKDDK